MTLLHVIFHHPYWFVWNPKRQKYRTGQVEIKHHIPSCNTPSTTAQAAADYSASMHLHSLLSRCSVHITLQLEISTPICLCIAVLRNFLVSILVINSPPHKPVWKSRILAYWQLTESHTKRPLLKRQHYLVPQRSPVPSSFPSRIYQNQSTHGNTTLPLSFPPAPEITFSLCEWCALHIHELVPVPNEDRRIHLALE